jgi:hypothetical protein
MNLKSLQLSLIKKVMTIIGILALVSSAAQAATDKDVQLLSKAIHFVEGGIGKEVAVIFDAASPDSVSDADTVMGLLAASGLTGSKVSVSSIGGASARVLYISKGLKGSWDSVSRAAVDGKKLTVTLDSECVKAAKCILAVQSAPSVEIRVNKAASASAGIGFGAAFKMMIKEY